MTDIWANIALILISIPVLAAGVALLLWTSPRALKGWGLGVIGIEILLVLLASPSLSHIEGGLTLLMVATAFLAILTQPSRKEERAVFMLTPVFVGLGLGAVAGSGIRQLLCVGGILALISGMILRHGPPPRAQEWGAISLYGLNLLGLSTSFWVAGPTGTSLALVAIAILLPVAPLHGPFIMTIERAPGTLPAVLAVFLPCLGFAEFSAISSDLPMLALRILSWVALLTALYAALRALVQISMERVLTYAFLAQCGILWWYIARASTSAIQAASYLSALSLVTAGLLLAATQLRVRFGHLDLDKLGGLALPMPRFAVFVTLLITAAIGLPFFPLFSGFLGLLLNKEVILSWTVFPILLTWLLASWQYPRLLQQVFFGRTRSDVITWDLCPSESLCLLSFVAILAFLGLVPHSLSEFVARISDLAPPLKAYAWHP